MPGRDYASDGAYYVTVCTVDRGATLGEIVDGQIRLNAVGTVVAETWRWLTVRYPYVTLDQWCVMPDHLHGILVLGDARTKMGGSRTAPIAVTDATNVVVSPVRRKPIGGLIGAFKTVSTKQINALRNTPGAVVWQRDFWDHIVRN